MSWADRLRGRGIIRDPVHGFIEIREIEFQLLQTPFLRRLHDVKQLGLNYLIFPGATHTRFSHSLGVMEVAGRIARRLVSLARSGRFCGRFFTNCDRGVEEFVEVARLSGLLHDLGHPPLSHQMETSLATIGRLEGLREVEGGVSPVHRAYMRVKEEGRLHEAMTRTLIRRIAEELEQEGSADALFVWASYYVLGGERGADALEELYINPEAHAILRSIISHPVFDADRLDYLLRDAMMSGVIFGNIDIDRLLIGIGLEEKDGRVAITVHPRSLPSLEDIFDARYKMFKSVYYHHKSKALNVALTKTLEQAFREWTTVVPRRLQRYLESPETLYDPDRIASMIASGEVLYTDSDLMGIISNMAVHGSETARRWAFSILSERWLLPISLVKRPESFLLSAIREATGRDVDPDEAVRLSIALRNKLYSEAEDSLLDVFRERIAGLLREEGRAEISVEEVSLEPDWEQIYRDVEELGREMGSLYMTFLSKLGALNLPFAFAYSNSRSVHKLIYRERDRLRREFYTFVVEILRGEY